MSAISNLAIKMTMNAQEFETGIESAGRKLQAFGDRATEAGRRLTGFLTLPIAGALGFAIDAASDLNESLSAVGTTYGDAAAGIIAASEDAAGSVMMSQQQYLAAATVLGVYGQAAGLTGDDLAAFGNDSIRAAADLASFYNIPVDEALAAIQAGLRGEAEPLSRFGILMNEAALEAYALEAGIWDGTGAMTEQQKVAARQGFIMANLGAANGDAARTSESFANRMKTLRATIANVAASIGNILLPYAIRLADWAQKLADRFTQMSDRTKKIVVIFALVAAAIGPLLIVVGTLAGAIASMIALYKPLKAFWAMKKAGIMGAMGPMLIIIAILAALYLIWKHDLFGIRTKILKWWDAFKASGGLDRLKARMEALKQSALELAARAQEVAKRILAALGQLWDRLTGPLAALAAAMIAGIGTAINFVRDNLYRLEPVIKAIQNLFGAFVEFIKAIFTGDMGKIWDAFKSLLISYVDFLKTLGSVIYAAVRDAIKSVNWSAVWESVKSGIGALTDWALDVALPTIGGAIVSGASSMWEWIKAGVSWLADTGADVAADWLSAFGSWSLSVGMPALGGAILTGATKLWDWIKAGASWIADTGLDVAADWLEGFGSWALSLPIPDIGGAIKDAFTSFWSWIADKVSWLAGFIDSDSVSKALGMALDIPIPDIGGAIKDAFTSFWSWVASKISWLAGFIDSDSVSKGLDIAMDIPLPEIAGKLFDYAGTFWGWVASKISWLAGFIDADTISKSLSVAFEVASGAVSVVTGFVDDVMGGIASAAGWVWDQASGAFSFSKNLVMDVVGRGGDGGSGGPSIDPIATQAAVEWLAAYDWSALATSIQTGLASALSSIESWAHGTNGIISTIFTKVKEGQGKGDWQTAFSIEVSKIRIGMVKALQALNWGWGFGGIHRTIFDKVKGAQGTGDWQTAFSTEATRMLSGLVAAIQARSWDGVITAIKSAVGAYSGGYAIGSDIGRGIYYGIQSWIGTIIQQAVSAVQRAIAAARSAAGTAGGYATASVAGVSGISTANAVTINVHGAGDPRLVAENVFAAFNRELSLRGGAL